MAAAALAADLLATRALIAAAGFALESFAIGSLPDAGGVAAGTFATRAGGPASAPQLAAPWAALPFLPEQRRPLADSSDE